MLFINQEFFIRNSSKSLVTYKQNISLFLINKKNLTFILDIFVSYYLPFFCYNISNK